MKNGLILGHQKIYLILKIKKIMTKFTILFITKRTNIYQSLNSCLKIKKYHSNLKIIILDGNKNNFLNDRLKILSEKVDLEIVKQKKSGFMNACMEAITYLDTGYFTFMYDDDILSPYFGKLVSYACRYKKQIYGYGKIHPKNKLFKFKNPKLKFILKKETNFMEEYFKFQSKKVLPNSPISSIFNVQIIKKWKYILKYKIIDEASKYLMMKKILDQIFCYICSV